MKDFRASARIAFVMGLVAAILQPVSIQARTLDKSVAAKPRSCPAQLESVAVCHSGHDANGAWYLAAVPKRWNKILVVHAHGGPRLGEPKADDSDEDLERFAIMVRSGYAWIGSTYRRGGYGVRMAGEDVDNSRAIFRQQFGKPELTILHGQSYGGNVAAKLAELRSVDGEGRMLYDGVLLTNGVLRGGTRAYGFRADLRAVYQYFCRNHPRIDEPKYPLWQGLPVDSTLTRRELEARVNECTGSKLPAEKRSPEQVLRLKAITGATGVAEDQLLRHLEWATFTFRDLVHYRLGGRNPFDNSNTRYQGSGNDENLNRAVERFTADPAAVRRLAYDSDLTGSILVPTIAIHWRNDPIIPATGDREYQAKIVELGGGLLFQSIWSAQGSHSRLRDADLMAGLESVVRSARRGLAVDKTEVLQLCRTMAVGPGQQCTMID